MIIMTKGTFKNLQLETQHPILYLLKNVLADMEMQSDEKSADRAARNVNDDDRLIGYIRKRNVIIAGFLSLLPIREFEKGITFEILPPDQGKKVYLKINDVILPIYTGENYLLELMMDANCKINPITIKEKERFVKYSINWYRDIFRKYFGQSFELNYGRLRALRVKELIKDIGIPPDHVTQLARYKTRVLGAETILQASEQVILTTKTLNYSAFSHKEELIGI